MTRTLDFKGHPWSEGEVQTFRLEQEIGDLSASDILRLTDRATGQQSFWSVREPQIKPGEVETVWQGVLIQAEAPSRR